MWIMILAIILMFLGNSSKDHWIVFIRSLQLIVTLAMINIPLPANSLYLLEALSAIAFYDILGQYDIWSYFPFVKFNNIDVPFINQQMQTVSYN